MAGCCWSPSCFGWKSVSHCATTCRCAFQSEASAEEPPIDTSTAEPQEDPSQSAFAAGLKEASQKARAQSPPSAIADAASQPQPDESTDSSKESRAELSHDAQVSDMLLNQDSMRPGQACQASHVVMKGAWTHFGSKSGGVLLESLHDHAAHVPRTANV